MKPYAALAGRVRQAMIDLKRVVDRAEELLEKANRTGDDGYLDGAALNLHGFCAGAERIFEDIARNIDDNVPSGPEWHRDLLLQMSATIDDVRPAIINSDTRYCLDEYRGFRHVVRNVYTFNLRPSRLNELIQDLRNCYESLVKEIEVFLEFLDDILQTND